MKIVGAIVGVVVLIAVAGFGYMLWSSQREAAKWDTAEEIVAESIEQDGQTWKIHMESQIDKPIDFVWEAVTQPERSAEYIDAFKKSELESHDGNTKVVQMAVQVLTLPLQHVTSTFVFDPENKRAKMSGKGSGQNMEATYQLVPSPDGTKTRIEYDAEATITIAVPLPAATQKGAFKQLFVETIRAIKKGIEEEEARRKAPQKEESPPEAAEAEEAQLDGAEEEEAQAEGAEEEEAHAEAG